METTHVRIGDHAAADEGDLQFFIFGHFPSCSGRWLEILCEFKVGFAVVFFGQLAPRKQRVGFCGLKSMPLVRRWS